VRARTFVQKGGRKDGRERTCTRERERIEGVRKSGKESNKERARGEREREREREKKKERETKRERPIIAAAAEGAGLETG